MIMIVKNNQKLRRINKMKILDKIGLALFSVIVLIISVILGTIIFGWIDSNIIVDVINDIIFGTVVARNIVIVILVLLILLAVKCIFFNSYSREEIKNKEGILLENDNGKSLVSRDTIENLATAVVKSFDSAESVMTKVEVDKETNIKIFITLFVYPNAVIKDLTNKLQTDVKEAIKKSLDLDVKEVNVRVKDINIKKEPTIKE